jgi:ABC-2 type transport system ATP-binding protein
MSGSAAVAEAPVVELRRFSKWYGDVVAVADLSFELRPGVTGLLGPNGAGKTTTLKAICGLLHPSQGEVLLFGRPISRDPMLYRAIGVVPDGDRLYPRLTVRSYVRLHAELQGLADAGAATERAIAEVDMGPLADRRLKGLSKGERQRTKVAGAIVHQPALLVLDEPMTGMDPGQRARFIELVRLIASAGVTVLVSSHILAEVERLASQILVLVSGRLAASGDYHAIRDLMADQPRTVMVKADEARRLAAGLIALTATPSGPAPARSTASPPPCPGWPATTTPPCVRSAPPTSPSSRSSATWWAGDEPEGSGEPPGGAPMSRSWRLLRFSLGQLLAGRRLIIVVLLVALPLVLPAVFAAGADVDPATFTLDLFRQLVLPVLLPVVALTFSTSSLGSELRDGTVTNLILKPIPRPAVLGAKYLAAVLASLVVLLPAEAVGHVVAARGFGSTNLLTGMLLATVVGTLAYCALGLLLSLLMARALLVGLAYALLWEGAVVSVAPSASSLSIRGYTEGVLAAVLHGGGLSLETRLGPVSATVLAALVTVAALVLAVRRLERMDIP